MKALGRIAEVAGWIILAIAGVLMARFCEGPGLAGMGDDSVSYLTLARAIAGTASADLLPWVPHQAHFPPLFPALLALVGGGVDLVLAHRVVAAGLILGLVATIACASRRLGGPRAGLAIAILFVAMPGAWIALKGILSETTYLVVSMATLYFHHARLEGTRGRTGSWAIFGVLVAACYLTRGIGIVMVIAAVAWMLAGWFAAWRSRQPLDAAPLAALVPLAVLAGAWQALRPRAEMDSYVHFGSAIARSWFEQPVQMAQFGFGSLAKGWIASFTADADVAVTFLVPAALFGATALAGSLLALRRNRLDGWYAIGTVVLIGLWTFGPDTARRLLYPVLPLLAIHAAEAIGAACAALGRPETRTRAWIVAAAILVVTCLPGLMMIEQRSRDVTAFPGSRYAPADMTEYYTTLDGTAAKASAASHVAALDGLEGLQAHSPPGSRVLWMRPEYVALLGDRTAVPYLFRWDANAFADQLLAQRVTHVVWARGYKVDVTGGEGDPARILALAAPHAKVAWRRDNAVTGGREFALLEVVR